MSNSLLLTCPDKLGLIYQLTEVFFQKKINITKLEEHVELGQFFVRVQWESKEDDSKEAYQDSLKPFCVKHNANYTLRMSKNRFKVVLLCSKPLHCLLDIFNQVKIGDLPLDIVCVISNHKTAQEFVLREQIPFYYVPFSQESREAHEKEIISILENYEYDAVGLARYMRVLSPFILSKILRPIINVHHAFLPSFKGADPYQQAFDRGVKVIGATSHIVTEDLDEGPIIYQDVQNVNHLASQKQLQLLGKESEKIVFSAALRKQAENKIIVFRGKTIVFH